MPRIQRVNKKRRPPASIEVLRAATWARRTGDHKRFKELHDVWLWWRDGGVLADRDDLPELWEKIDEIVKRETSRAKTSEKHETKEEDNG